MLTRQEIIDSLRTFIISYRPSNDPYGYREVSDRGGDAEIEMARDAGKESILEDLEALLKDF